MREAFRAGCRLASTETRMTMVEIRTISRGFTVGARTSPLCLPKSKVTTPDTFRKKMIASPIIFPITTPMTPRQSPSMMNMDRILPGSVPMAAMVPISRTLSYTAMIITFMMLMRTTAISISWMNIVIISIIRATL